MEKRGIPAAVICSEPFLRTGQASAKAAGLTDYPFIVVPHPVGSLPEDGLRARAEVALPRVVELLSAKQESV